MCIQRINESYGNTITKYRFLISFHGCKFNSGYMNYKLVVKAIHDSSNN